MVAEILHSFFPQLIDLNNYKVTVNRNERLANWLTLNSNFSRETKQLTRV